MTTLTTWCGLMNAQSSCRPTVNLLVEKEESHAPKNKQGLYWFLYIHVMLIADRVIVGSKWSSIKACILLIFLQYVCHKVLANQCVEQWYIRMPWQLAVHIQCTCRLASCYMSISVPAGYNAWVSLVHSMMLTPQVLRAL